MAALRARLSTLLTVGMVVLGTAAPASAEISRVGVVTTLDGTATLSRVALPQGVPLKVRDDVFVADRIVTGDKSFARILFGGKAIVTVRERSVLTITEAPGTSTIDVSIGRVAVAVVKERMKPGESVEIRTPNAVAGIRGTVVVAEVAQATSQLGATSGGFTTTITVLKGRIEFRQLDRLTRQPSGPGVPMGALQSIRVTGFAAPRPVQKVPSDVQQQLINDFRVPLRGVAATTNSAMAEGQLRQAISAVGAQLGVLSTSDTPAPAKSEDNQGSNGKSSEDNQGRNAKASEDNQGSSGNTSGSGQGRNAKAGEDSQGSNGNTGESSQGRNAKASDDGQGSNGNTSESGQGRNAKTSGDNQGRNAKAGDDSQGSNGNTSGSNKAGKGNSNASSSPSGNPGSTVSGGTASVTGGSGVSGGAAAGIAPVAAPSAPSSVTPAAPPATSGGTAGARSVPAVPTVQNVPVNVTSGNQGNLGTSTNSAIQKAIDKASKSKSRSRR